MSRCSRVMSIVVIIECIRMNIKNAVRQCHSAVPVSMVHTQNSSLLLYAMVAQRTAMRPPKLKTSPPLSAEVAAASPPPPLPLSSLPPVAAAPPPKLPRADPVTEENVSLLFCPVGCMMSRGREIDPRSRNLETMSGPKKSRMKTMRRKK